MKNRLLVIVIFVLGLRVWAQNPIVPPGMYIADPEAHVWNDDKLYIYGSKVWHLCVRIYITYSRQLLVSNAFEELIEEKLPKIHSIIRQQYNKAGNVIHKHYHIFNIKLVSDFVYVLMKPLELLFLFTLYTCDKKPENRIATQYLTRMDKEKIKSIDALTMRPTKTVG